MPTRNRLKGNRVTFLIEGEEYNIDCDSIVLSHVESDDDFVSFGEGDANYEHRLTVRAAQSTDAESLHTFLWENAGVVATADFVFGVHGNPTPSVSQPHVSGTIEISAQKPDLGGEKNSTWTFEREFKVVGEVTKVTSATP